MKPKRIIYDLMDDGPAPDVGDVLDSSRSSYQVLSIRIVHARDGARRFSLEVVRLNDDTRVFLNTFNVFKGRRFTLRWKDRGRRPRPGDAQLGA